MAVGLFVVRATITGGGSHGNVYSQPQRLGA